MPLSSQSPPISNVTNVTPLVVDIHRVWKTLCLQRLQAAYGADMIRLRQIALVAHSLEEAITEVSETLDLDVIFRDPGVAHFGLHNALFCLGDQFIEIVSPIQEGTTAGRLLDKRGGDGGYMALFEVDNLDERLSIADMHNVRRVWQGAVDGIRGAHLHPRDTGGTLVSIDQPDIPGEWAWGGPSWKSRRPSSIVSAIDSFTVGVPRPTITGQRWRALDIDHSVEFTACAQRGEGLDSVTLTCIDPSRDGESVTLVGTTFTLRAAQN